MDKVTDMDMEEAQERAKEKIKDIAGPLKFNLATNSKEPLKLPHGWRFPYNILLNDGNRIGGVRLILFVPNDRTDIEIEWSDIDHIKVSDTLEDRPPALDDALNRIEMKYQDIRVETIERIWAVVENKLKSVWRILFYEATGSCRSVWIGFDAKGKIELLKDSDKSLNMAKWDIGRCRYRDRSRNITIKLNGLSSDEQPFYRSRWLIWSCMSHASEYLTRLGYSEIKYDEIRISLKNNGCSGAKCAQTNKVGPLSEISFRDIKKGWANDPTIVCHELGHAVWYLLFAPKPTKDIEEGFADYFAATLVASGKPFDQVELGGGLPAKMKKRLTRLVDGQPDGKPYLFLEKYPYRFGLKWANLLWNLRQEVGPESADKIILLAHFKPFTDEHLASKGLLPMKTYFQSLIKTASYLKIDFNGWEQLAKDHRLNEI